VHFCSPSPGSNHCNTCQQSTEFVQCSLYKVCHGFCGLFPRLLYFLPCLPSDSKGCSLQVSMMAVSIRKGRCRIDPNCGREFEFEASWTRHEREHFWHYKCPGQLCDNPTKPSTFVRKCGLVNHINEKHKFEGLTPSEKQCKDPSQLEMLLQRCPARGCDRGPFPTLLEWQLHLKSDLHHDNYYRDWSDGDSIEILTAGFANTWFFLNGHWYRYAG
jgi:hypothetical protein